MKKIVLLGLIVLLFTGCEQPVGKLLISYEINNRTEYDLTLIDARENNSEFHITPYTHYHTSHVANGDFRLKDDELPIKISNGYNYTEISMLNSYKLHIFNHTYNRFTLNIHNSTHKSSKTFNIEPHDCSLQITVFSNEFPEIQFLKDGEVYSNFSIHNTAIIIN